ncbi:phosphoribosylglycinamide formyltransferase [Sulfitobacter sp. D35]|uniref:phosphoribosylglycinamide formyltransferase n=1 Tax=Sulfitobacter sp. D35 TaxID=3083252 RepID=UPI00296FE5FC|nr:phosphoribosylglycinamide formyltransferase [Sulfitobacter sp. D35]MDW4496366.1 phosphoribosylglycinamide formyltransferase [Sulfitobacter sp. D35]
MTTRVAIFISGGGSNMQKLVESMTGAHPARPCLVLSNVETAGGLEIASAAGIPTVAVSHKPFAGDRAAFEAALTEAIAPHAPDLICLAGFMRKLTAGFVEPWAGRMLNIHPSLLPKYRGLDTHARALAAGDALHGCTVHEVTPELDDGPILGQATVPIAPGDTPETLAARVLTMEHRLYPEVLRRFVAGEGLPVRLAA